MHESVVARAPLYWLFLFSKNEREKAAVESDGLKPPGRRYQEIQDPAGLNRRILHPAEVPVKPILEQQFLTAYS